ncbi:MAG: FtsW/RodA/SpoVE family cell cycle protein [Firmicutes bacterium]|nr:FtsW/RodA/SpoVE family cell cycle protein [Bacillota bacterium]
MIILYIVRNREVVTVKKVLSKIDKPLFFSMLIFFIFGLIMIFSASTIVSVIGFNKEPYSFFIKQALFLFVGLIAFFIILFIPTKNYSKFSNTLLITVLLALAGLFVYGKVTNNAMSWYYIGPFSLQPSEFAKTILIIYMGTYYYKNRKNLNSQNIILKPLYAALMIFALVFLQPDLGTGIIIAAIAILIYFSLPIKTVYKKNMITILLIVAIMFIGLYLVAGKKILTTTQLNRFNYKEPCKRYTENTGYQVCNGYIAINNGGLFGVGLGNSTQKYLYLPEAHTDFIFPIVIEELGVITGIAVILMYIFIIYRILKISRDSNNLGNSVMAYGIAAYIFCHIAVNLVGILGLGPMTGVPLPFLSYGGSFALNLMITFGIVQRIAIENKISKSK